MADHTKGFQKVAQCTGNTFSKPGHELLQAAIEMLESLGYEFKSWVGSVPELMGYVHPQTGVHARISYVAKAPETSSVTLSDPAKIFPRRLSIGDFIVRSSTQLAQQRVDTLVTAEKNKRKSPPPSSGL